MTQADYEGLEGAAGAGKGSSFDCGFTAIDAKTPFRPQRVTPKPRVPGPQTAVVVGPPDEEIHTDEYGRVKVHFHWDRYGNKDGEDTCWVRVSQVWAGQNFGFQAVPRIGQEVVVDFLEGDPDQPLITGRVYNAEQKVPWTLPANKTQTGVLTRSTPGGNTETANAIRFEDKKGEEEIWFHAERNYRTEVENSETKTVGADRSKTIGGNETTSVKGNRTETVGGHEKITIKKTQTQTIYMAHMQTIGLGKMVTVGGAYNTNVGLGRIDSTGLNWMQVTGKKHSLTVGQQFTIICGQSKLEMKESGEIRLVGKSIELNGSGSDSVWNASGIVHKTAGNWVEYAASFSMNGPQSVPIQAGPAQKECQECKNMVASKTAHSINFATGQESFVHHDFSIAAPMPLSWSRRYHSRQLLQPLPGSPLGMGWINTWLTRLLNTSAEQMLYFADDGRVHECPLPLVGQKWMHPIENFELQRIDAQHIHIAYGPDWLEEYEAQDVPIAAQENAVSQKIWRLNAVRGPAGQGIQLLYGLTSKIQTVQVSGAIVAQREDANPSPVLSEAHPHPLSPSHIQAVRWQSDENGQESVEIVAQLRTQLDAQGRIYQLWQNRPGQINTTEPPSPENAWLLAQYHYDSAGNLIQAWPFPAGQEPGENPEQLPSYQYSYEQGHLITRYTDLTGRGINIQWNEGRAVKEWPDGAQAAVSLSWGEQGQAIVTDALGHKTVHHCDNLGYTHQIDHPDGSSERFVRDEAKNVLEHHHGDGRVDHYRYDKHSRRIRHTRPDNSVEQYRWTSEGRLAEITDAAGGSWQRSYNEAGLLKEQSDPLGHKTSYRYDDKGQMVGIINALGKEKKLSYTETGQLASYTDCSGKTTRWSYDEHARLLAVENAAGQKLQYHYERGQLAKIVQPDQSVLRFERDAAGRLLSHTDALAHTTHYQYDQAGRLLKRQDALAGVLHYAYDDAGQIVRLVNEIEQTWHFKWDSMGRLMAERDFEGQVNHYRYSPAGALLERKSYTDAQTQQANQHSLFHYDALLRVIKAEHQQINVQGQTEQSEEQFTYDVLGRPTLASNAVSQLRWHYDALGQVQSESLQVQLGQLNWTALWQHQYDALGNRVTTTRPDGSTLQWLNYGSGHVHGLLLDGIELIGFERDALHRESMRHLGNWLTQSKQYDEAGRLAAVNIAPIQTPHPAGLAPSTEIKRQYKYDPVGQLQQITDSARGQSHYLHDALGRLIEATGSFDAQAKEHFAFDPASNLRLSKTLQADGLGRCTHLDPEHSPLQTATQLSWDVHNRLVFSQQTLTDHTREVRYWYDALGRRIAKHSSAKVAQHSSDGEHYHIEQQKLINQREGYGLSLFAWDGDTLGLEFEYPTQKATHYLYEPSSFVPLLQYKVSSKKHSPHKHIQDIEDLAFYHCDHLGTPQEMSDAQGEIVWSGRYAAFGQARHIQQQGSYRNPIRFQGQYEDAETGLHYNYHRYYNPSTGAYLSKDPIGLGGGTNLFLYALGRPNNFIDPLGLQSGGPYHPPPGVSVGCKSTDTCREIEGKMFLLDKMIKSHQGWDWSVPSPRGGGRHAEEIAGLWGAFAKCQALYARNNCSNKKPPSPEPTNVPIKVGVGATILAGIGFVAWKIVKTAGCTVVASPAGGVACALTPP